MRSFDNELRKGLQKAVDSTREKKSTAAVQPVASASTTPAAKKNSFSTTSMLQKTSQKDEAFERLQSAYSSLDQSSRQRYAGLVQQALGASAQSYASDYSALQDLFSRESSRTGYRSADDARLFNQRASEQAQSLTSRAERYQKMMDLFGSDMDEDFRTSFTDMLSGTGEGVSQMRKYASDTQDFFSQFADESEYNAYQDMMSHYNAAKDAGKTTMQWYDDALSARDEADARFDEAQRRLADFENKSGELMFDPETGAFLGTRSDLGNDYSVEIGNARADRDAAAKEKAERARDLYYADMFRYQDWQINDEDVLAGKEKMEVADAANQAISEMGRRIDYSNYAQTAGDLSYAEPLADQYKRDWSYKQPTDKWEQKDLDLYYSLFNSDPALADEYAIKINNQINSQAYAEKVKPVQEWMVREEGKWGRNIATGGAALAAGVATAPEDFFDYLDMMAQLAGRGVVMQKADPILADYADEMVSTRAKDLNDLGTIQSGWLEGKGLGDLYQLSESVLESITLGNLAGPLGTSAVFFGSAAKDALKSSLASGASPKQAMIYSVVSGLNEAAWEYFSVDKMLSMKSPKNLAQFFGGLLTQGFVEGSEEFNTSLANSVAQAMILKDKSDIELNIQRYISEGMSYDEARKKAMQDWGKGLASDFAGGMISGMASGGVQQVVSSVRDSLTAVDDQSARDIIEYGREAGDPKARALAEKYQKRIEQLDRKGNPGKLSVAQYNKLDRTATESYVQGDIETTASAVEEKLKVRGIESPALARAIATEALRQEAERVGAEAPKLTREQKQLLNGNHMAEQILNDLDVGNLRNEASGGGFTYRDNSWVKDMKPTKLLASDVYGSQAATSTISESEKNGVTLDGQKVRIVGAQDGKVTVEKNGQRQTVELDELQGLSDGYRQLIEAAGETKSAEPMLRLYQPGQDVGRYISAWNYAENVFGAQTTNTTLEEVRKSPLVKELDDVQLKYAFEMGRERAQQRAQEVKAKAEERKAAREEAKKRGAEKRRKGTVSVDGAEINGKKYKGVNEKKLTTSQKKVVAMVRALADAVNIDYVVYDGNPDEGGTYVKGGTVLININSGQLSTKNLGAATVSHELTHYLQDFAPEEYEQLKGFITQHIMKKSPAQFDALVRQQQKLDPKLSYDKSVDEVIANACQKMLLNSRAVTQLARQNMTLAEKIQDAIADISEKIKAAFEGVDLKDDIAVYRAAREISDVMDQVQELWDKALLAADASYNAVEQTGMKSASDTSGEAQNMYLGERAREADTTALDAAREMEKKGESAETIRQKTGWFRGMDGKWRFEIDDSKIKWESAGDIQFRKDHPEYDEYRNLLDKMCNSPELLTEDEQKRLVELDDMWSGELSRLSQRVKNGRVKLGNVLRHESLFRNYPGLKDVYIEFADLGTSNGQLVARSDEDSVIQINRSQRADPRSTLIHEIQHAIQHIEGFSTGSSPDAWSRRLDSGYVERRRSAEFEAADQKYRDLFDNAPEQLKNKIRELNRAKLNSDLDLWDQIEAELYDGPYGKLFMEIDKADMERDRIRNQDRQIDAYELYRNTAGEIEARDVQYRQRYDAEKRKNTPPDLGDENTVFADAAEIAQEIKKAVGNKPFVEIQDDILSGVAQKDWISTVWNTLQAKFPGAIRIGNSNILIDKQSRDELTRSKSTGYLARNNQQMYEDKLRSMYNADELLKATTDWINEKVNHARKDKIVDFARGHVLFRVGSNDYVGEVVVGNRANGEMILYDIVRIQPTTITAKEVDVRDARNPLPENSRLQTSASSVNSISDSYAKSNPQNLDEEQHQRWGMAETEEEREARRESVANLKAENRILRVRAEYWKGQTQQTRERTVRQQDTDRLANDLLREYESRADKAEVKAALKDLGDWLVQSDGDTLSYDELRERARAIAEDIVDGNYALIDDSQSEMLGRLKDYLKSTPVNLSAEDWRDTGDEHFRRRYGRYFTVSERGRTIDSLWGELSATFGESLFPEDTYAPGDMLNMIGDYLDLWKPQYGNVFEQYRGEAVDAAANEIIDAMLGEEVRQSAATYADRAQQRLNAQIAKDKDRLDALREQKNARIEEIKREAAEKIRQVRLSEKAMKYEAVDKVKQHYRDMMQRQRGKRSDTALRGKIKKLHRELSDMLVKPGEKRYVPRELVKATAEILNSIDTTSGRAVKAKAALAELRVQYEAMAKDDHYALTYDETVSGMLQELAENIGDGSIYDLTGSELESVYNVLRALKTTIQNANRLVGAQIEATAFEAGNQMMTEATNAKSVPTVLLRKFVFGQATPETAFSLFGGYKKNSMWHQMYEMLNRGQLTQTQIMMEGGAIFRELIDDKQMKTLHDRKNLVDIGLKDADGNAILVTRGMMLSVYMHLQNEQNTRHIAYGGLTVPRLREYYKSKMKEAFTGKTGHAVAFFEEIQEVNRQLAEAETQEEKDALSERLAELQDETDAYIDGMRSKIEEQLTEYDRKWIAAAQEFFDVYSKGKLNEVTEMVYGFQKAQVERYFPIHTDPDYRTASFDTITRDMSLENAGFMKERVTASNPILLEDITDVISSQLRRTAQYCGLMPVIRNFNKAYGKSRTGYTMTVQKAVGETFGVEGKKYIENLISDLNGARKTEANIFDALRGNMAGAALTVNLRVTLSQTASWPTAAAEIGYRPLTKALVDMKNPMWDKGLREEIAKWTPLYWYRMQGYSTAELGDIKSNEQLMNRIMQKTKWLTGWIQFADGLTTGGLWQASKYYVDENFSDLRRGSDEYMMKVAEVYNRVIERTQPDYTTMQRPDILRNPHAVVKQLTMFMTQRLQNTNLLFSSAAEYMKYSHDLKAGINGVTVEDVSVARTRFLWAGTSQLIASGMIVLFKAAADAIMHSMNAYRDDDDELTKESVVHTLLVNFAETLTSNFLGGAELFTLLKSAATGERYYGISLNGVDTINTTLTETLNTYKKLKDKNADAEAKWKQVGKLAKAAGQFIGAPVGNLMKWAEMIMNHAEDIRNGEFGSFEAGVDRTRTQNTRLLYEALQAGDAQKAEKLKAEFKDEKDVRSSLKTYIKQIYTEDKQIMKAEVITMLQRYCGMTRRNAENTAKQWTMQVVTGMSYDKLDDEYIAGNVPRNTASRYLQTYGGKTQAEAEAKISEWQCEKDTGIAYSDIANEVKIGNISPERAVDMLVKYGGKDPDAAEKTVEGYMIEHEYGFTPSELQDEYLAGNVSDADAFDILMSYKYFGKEDAEEKAADELERLQFVRANPGTEEISITQARNYQSSGLSGYISPVDYMQAAKMMGTFHGVDADGDGKTDSYSVVTQKLAYIDTLKLTPEQKSRLAQALGINEKTIRKKAPWLK